MPETSQTPSGLTNTREKNPTGPAADPQAAAIRTSSLPGEYRESEAREGGSAERKRSAVMTAKDMADVVALARGLNASAVLDTDEHLKKGVEGARSSLIAATTWPHGSFIQRCVSWLGRGFGLFSPPIQRAQARVSESLKQLREHSDVKVKPIADEIRKRYEDKTFVRTAETPRALVLAAVPTELKHLDHDFDYLKSQLRALVKQSEGALQLIKGLGDQRIVISRKGQYGNDETLELAFRREGKVTVFLNGKEMGGMWNGLAVNAAKKFAAGEEPRFVKTIFQEYTVTDPAVVSKARQAASREASSGNGAEQVTKQSFESLQRTVAQFVDSDIQNEKGIRFFHDGPKGGRFSVIRKSENGKQELLQVVSKEGDRSQIVINGRVLGTFPNQEVMRTVSAFVNGNKVRERQTAAV